LVMVERLEVTLDLLDELATPTPSGYQLPFCWQWKTNCLPLWSNDLMTLWLWKIPCCYVLSLLQNVRAVH
jgi:hypothetical protein